MKTSVDPIRLIFGLKLRQFRTEKGFSLQELSERCDISPSYLNEIEKGKKYPKTDKILALAQALEINFDQLISSDLKKALGTTGEIINSNFFTDVPFEFFGIDPSKIIEIIVDAPDKFSALVNTLIKIGRSYNVSVEKLYFAVLRSYLEIHKNYFPELEELVDNFYPTEVHDEAFFKKYLRLEHNLKVETYLPEKHPEIANLRTVLVPKHKKYFLNQNLSKQQVLFALAREAGFRHMNIKVRPLTSTWVSVHSFDEVFNNFKASYFASALLIPKVVLVDEFRKFFSTKKLSTKKLIAILDQFPVSYETVFYRMFSMFPVAFNLEKIYFLKFETPKGARESKLVKEIHLVGQHDPQESRSEHYCRRWPGIDIFEEIKDLSLNVKYQISNFKAKGNQYFEIAFSREVHPGKRESITLGFEINADTQKVISFLDDPKIVKKEVGQTCEKCTIFDCKERVASPSVLYNERRLAEINKAIENLK